MEDSAKIERIFKDLPGGKEAWMEAPGYHALTKFEFADGKNLFNPSTGLPIKIFIQRSTGEIRIFPARSFEKE